MDEKDPRAVLAFALVAGFFILIQAWSLTGPTVRGDERLYFFSAHQMAASGDWLTPRDEFSRFRVHKPPLYTWATALVFKLTGPGLAAQRIISILAALGTALLTFGLARLLLGSARLAALAGIILLGFTEVFLTTHQGRADGLFMFLITAAIYALARVLAGSGRPLAWALLGWFLAGLAFLTKGPYGLLHPLLPVLALALWDPALRKRTRYLLHPLAILVFIVTAGAWYAALTTAHTPAIWGQILGDLAKHGPEGNILFNLLRNLGRYIPALLTTALPWWPLIILGLLALRLGPKEGSDPKGRATWFLPLAWIGVVVLTVFINPTWARRYILPLYPALALMGAALLIRLEESRGRLRSLGLPLVLAVLSAVFLAAMAPLLWGYLKHGRELTDNTAFLLPSVAAVVVLVGLLWLARRKHGLLGWAVCLACLSILVNGALDRNYNVAGNRGAVAALAVRHLAPLKGEADRVLCLGMHWADCVPILDRGGKVPLTRLVFGDPGGIVWDRLAFPDISGRTYAVTMTHLWEEMEPELKASFQPLQGLDYVSLVRSKGVLLKLDRRRALLLELKSGRPAEKGPP